MYDDFDEYEDYDFEDIGLYEHKRSDKVKWIISFLLIFVLLAGLIGAWVMLLRNNEEAPPAENTEQSAVTDGDGGSMDEGAVYPMPREMSFSAAAFAGEQVTSSDTQGVEVRIEAYVYPESAANKEVDYSVAWGNAPEHGSESVADYLTVTPDSDGSRLATVLCKKGFGGDTILITATTRDGGYTATCTVTFVGIASGIEITSSEATEKNSAERGDYFEIGTSKTYAFAVNLTNVFGEASGDLTVTEIGGVGSAYFGKQYSNDGGYYYYEDIYKKDINELADKFITSATVSGTTLTVKTGSKVLETYYSSYELDENMYSYAEEAYVAELDDYWNIKTTGDAFNIPQAEENAQNLASFYFYVTVKDNLSGLTATVKLWPVSSVSGISLTTKLTF